MVLFWRGSLDVGAQKEAESREQFPRRPWGACRMRVSSWQPDVGGQAEREVKWCQSGGGRRRQDPRGPPGSCLGYRREGGQTVKADSFLTESQQCAGEGVLL